MAGQADRSAAGRTGPTSRRPTGRGRSSAGAPLNSVAIPVGADEQLALPEPQPQLALPAPMGPDLLPRDLRTQATYRLLVSAGVPSDDAAALIGYAVGLAPCRTRWSLKEINRLLFLRNLYAETAWGETEREPA